MKKSWYWVLLIFAGSMPFGNALQYYIAGEAYRNTLTRNWLVVGQACLGILIMGFGLYRQVRTNRAISTEADEDTPIKLNDD